MATVAETFDIREAVSSEIVKGCVDWDTVSPRSTRLRSVSISEDAEVEVSVPDGVEVRLDEMQPLMGSCDFQRWNDLVRRYTELRVLRWTATPVSVVSKDGRMLITFRVNGRD